MRPWSLWLLLLTVGIAASARAQSDDGGVTLEKHQAVLQSIEIPHVANQPLRLTLLTEWIMPTRNGGTITQVNSRPIIRDSKGRLYQERWLLAPKGWTRPLQMSWIQIADPLAHTLLECNARTHVCDLERWHPEPADYDPQIVTTGPAPGGKTYREHIDLGAGKWLNIPVEQYRDLETPLPNPRSVPATVREFSYAPSLSLNLRSVVESPTIGQQSFIVSEITLGEPDAKWFHTPAGYTVRDVRGTPEPDRKITVVPVTAQ